MASKQKLVVIGNGMAGARAVEEILARGGGDQFEITMFGDEPYGNYNRILLSDVLNGSHQADEIFLNPLAWYTDNGIKLHAGIRAEKIQRSTRQVFGRGGVVESYDVLIIATGSLPFLPPIDGLHLDDGAYKPGVFVFRTLDDCNAIATYALGKKSGAVIGGGLLGLEAARGLQNFSLDVHVVQRSDSLMNQQLDGPAGVILRKTLEELGISVLVGKDTRRIAGRERVNGLEFADGGRLDCDLVVVAAGIKPNVELALRAGLDVERGIVVDNHLKTSDPRIFAVGECVQHRGQVYGLVAPLWEQAKVLADQLTGANPEAAYFGSKIATKLKVMGVEVASMGVTEPTDEGDEVVQFTEPKKGTYKKLIIRNGRLIGGILLGDIAKAPYLTQAYERSTPVPDERLSLLFDIGAPSAQASVETMPPEMQVCNCNGVTKSAIGACVKSGKKSPKAVMEATRAGMGCGACKGLVAEVVAWAAGGAAAEEDPSAEYYVPGIPLSKPELVRAVREQGLRSVSAVFAALADGVEDAASKPGLASLLISLWAEEYEDERDARFINDRVHANIQKDGTFSVIPQMPGGVTTAAQLRRIADVAEKYRVPLVKLTGGQRIDLVGVSREDLPKMWRDLGMPSGHAYGKRYRTCKSCIGTDYCRFGLGDSMKLATEIEERFQGLESPGKLKLATAGCPRNCSEAMVKDVGAVAIGDDRWEIYVGGAAGAHVRKGDLLCRVASHADVLRITGRFLQYYRENAKYLERTYGFVARVGIEKLRAVIVDDSEGIAERLDAALARSVAAYRDPWLEAEKPATPNQFRMTLPIVQ